jgi:peptidoglycan/LPS O-acetylase OafA/YrhL
MSEKILAVVACCSMLAAVLMAAFAYRLNEKWTELMKKMNRDWLEFTRVVVNAMEENNDRD